MITIKMSQLPPFVGWFGFVYLDGEVRVFRRHMHFCQALLRAHGEAGNTAIALGIKLRPLGTRA